MQPRALHGLLEGGATKLANTSWALSSLSWPTAQPQVLLSWPINILPHWTSAMATCAAAATRLFDHFLPSTRSPFPRFVRSCPFGCTRRSRARLFVRFSHRPTTAGSTPRPPGGDPTTALQQQVRHQGPASCRGCGAARHVVGARRGCPRSDWGGAG